MDNYIMHVGVGWDHNPPGVGSSRYPHGSGANPNQHDDSFKGVVDKMRKKGMTDGQIAKVLLGDRATAADLKARLTIERMEAKEANRTKALQLYDECNGNVSEVARRMYGDPSKESYIRKLLNPAIQERDARYRNTADFLKEKVANTPSGIIDVSSDTELYLGVTRETKKVALKMLEDEGYMVTWVKIPQATTGHETTVKVLASPDLSWKDVQDRKYEIGSITEFTPDEGKTFETVKPPVSIDSKRIFIRYAEDGGVDRDGTIELRRNVPDTDLAGSLYSQVRIAVDGKYYMKGMAMYSDDVPEGYDIIYNTNKKRGSIIFPEKSSDSSVFKLMKNDPDNPFGAMIKPVSAGGQHNYIGKDGKEHQSVINKVSDEGDWDDWSKRLASQFLSKQDIPLIKKQLELSVMDKKAELESIRSLTNPAIKQKLLDSYADKCDSDASSLAARGFKGSAFQVLLPVPSLKDNEIYAPNYKDGEQVALIRYPHGGIFEIPVLTVNNKNPEANRTITKNAKDAVGINQYNADILSGADYDGDTALVIPLTSNNIKIKYAPKLKELEDFPHKELYRLPDSAPPVKNSTKQREMGIVTNLITDMSVGGADLSEIAKAVKHSMVVIDSEKHHLDYKKSAKDNDIIFLKKKYQEKEDGTHGASTILSRASSDAHVEQRKEITNYISMTPEEKAAWDAGKKVYRPTGKTKKEYIKIDDPSKMTKEELYLYKSGKKVYRDTGKVSPVMEEITQMDLHDDARELVRDKTNKREMAYANYANELKSLARQARKESRSIIFVPASPSAKATYSEEVASLNRKLRLAKSNNPKERLAQARANYICKEKFKDATQEWDYEHKQRERARALEQARIEIGAKKQLVEITDKEWQAIQANAISPTKLKQILNNTDQDKFKQRAMPKETVKLTKSQTSLIKQMAASGQYTNKEIAERLGISPSTVSKTING